MCGEAQWVNESCDGVCAMLFRSGGFWDMKYVAEPGCDMTVLENKMAFNFKIHHQI